MQMDKSTESKELVAAGNKDNALVNAGEDKVLATESKDKSLVDPKAKKKDDEQEYEQAPGVIAWFFGWKIPKRKKNDENKSDKKELTPTERQAELKLRAAEVTSYGQIAAATADIVSSTNNLGATYLTTRTKEKEIRENGRQANLNHEQRMDAQSKTHTENMSKLALEEKRLAEEARQFDQKLADKKDKRADKKSEIDLKRDQLVFDRERWLFERNARSAAAASGQAGLPVAAPSPAPVAEAVRM